MPHAPHTAGQGSRMPHYPVSAGPQGFEPRLPRPERGVLPLHQGPPLGQKPRRYASRSAISLSSSPSMAFASSEATSTPSASSERATASSSERSTVSAPATLPSLR